MTFTPAQSASLLALPRDLREVAPTREEISPLSVVGHLFQARMWREFVRAWDGIPTSDGIGREWVEHILQIPRDECLRRAFANVRLARNKNAARGTSRPQGRELFNNY